MAKTMANCTIWVDDVAIASQVNQVTIQKTAAELDVTTFANASIARLGGLKDGVISASGFWESTPDPDFSLFGDVGNNVPITVALTRASVAGDPAYIMCAEIAQYGGIGAKVGNPLAFSLRGAQVAGNTSNAGNVGQLAQGILAESRTATTTGNGNIYGPLAVPANALQEMVAAIHATAISGTATPTLTVSLQSSAAIGFASPTTRATFTALTATGSQSLEVDGPITDQYWRFTWTISGTTPSFTFAAALGLAT